MLIRLAVPFADVCADDLSLALGGPAAPALEVLRAKAAGWAVELRLLGYSHQALVDGGAELSETVACRPGVPGFLPAHRRGGAASGDYAFSARVDRLSAARYAERAAALLDAAAADPAALAGLFPAPGSAPAFTTLSLRALRGAVAWTTWHGYPQTGELVVTESRLERPA